MWRISSGMKYVLSQLPVHPDFTPAIQIRLARQYDIKEWTGAAFRSLVERPLSQITLADAEHMGIVTFYKLIQTKARISNHNIGIAFHPPPVQHSFSCRDENACSRVWETFWWGGYSKQLLHPDNPKTPAVIMLDVDPTKGMLTHMPELCVQNTIQHIWEDNPFNDAKEFVDEASNELAAWMAES